MEKRKKIVIFSALALAVILIGLMAGVMLYRYLGPSNTKRDLNTIFKTKENEIALVADNKLLKEKGLLLDGQEYVPISTASEYFDERIYFDEKELVMSYATAAGLIQAKPDAATYVLGKENKQSDAAMVKKVGNGYYISLAFINEHAANSYKEYKNPTRIVVMSERTEKYTFATLSSDTRVRTGPGKKYDYLTEAAEGARVIVNTGTKKENGYEEITTADGVTGYIPIDRVEKTEEATWTFEKTPESFAQKSLGKTVCLGWHQMTNATSSSSMYSGINQAKGMNVISPTWYALSDNKGNFTSLANTSYVTQAHTAGLQVWGLINDFKSSLNLKKLLGKTSSRTKLINSLVASAIQYDLDGINIDFEKVTAKSASAYLQFLRELTLKCHAVDLIVSVDNYPVANYNSFYNYEEQGRIVDYVIVMAYDEHYAGSDESGSVSSYQYVSDSTKNMLAKVPKERAITALPFYTRLWRETKQSNGKVKVSSNAYGMSGAESVLKSNGVTPKWDDTTGQYYAQFNVEGSTYKIWMEEETSLKQKLQNVMKQKVAGVAFWKLGFERAVTWSTISEAIK